MIPKQAKYRWLGPKPDAPRCEVGDVVTCEIHGDCVVTMWQDHGQVQWPKGRPVGRCGPGGMSIIVTPQLAEAIKRESESAIMHWLGVAKQTVQRWRRALGVPRHNEGTLELRRSETGDADRTAEFNRDSHPHNWRAAEDELLGSASDQAVAVKTGRTLYAVQRRRQSLGIPANNNKRLGRPRR